MAGRTIVITRSPQTVTGGAASGLTLSYTYSVMASGAVNMPAAIFKMNQHPADPNNPASPPVNTYQGVATPADLAGLPVNNPNPGSGLFLTSAITLTFANQTDADTAWLALIQSVQTLKTALDLQDQLRLGQVFIPV